MFIPFINRFTCTQYQIQNIITINNKLNIRSILAYINEDPSNFKKNYKINKRLSSHIYNSKIALKLSSLNINNDYEQALCMSSDIVEEAIKKNNSIIIDAEYHSIQDDICSITDRLMQKYNKNKINIFKTYQMYRPDYYEIFKEDLLKERDYKIGFKLVRGAYLNEEKGQEWIATTKRETDDNYNGCILMFNEYNKHDKLICATHNEKSCYLASSLNNKDIEYAQLMGMSNNLTQKLSSKNTVYKYIPFGSIHETIPYLTRRISENISFTKYLFK